MNMMDRAYNSYTPGLGCLVQYREGKISAQMTLAYAPASFFKDDGRLITGDAT